MSGLIFSLLAKTTTRHWETGALGNMDDTLVGARTTAVAWVRFPDVARVPCGLSLFLVAVLALRSFSRAPPVFLPPHKPIFNVETVDRKSHLTYCPLLNSIIIMIIIITVTCISTSTTTIIVTIVIITTIVMR